MHPRSNFFHFHAVFSKILSNNLLSPQTHGLAPPVWEILDPPLNMEHSMISTISFTQTTLCVRPLSIISPFEFVKIVKYKVKVDMTLIE